jgi:hypothetical protein
MKIFERKIQLRLREIIGVYLPEARESRAISSINSKEAVPSLLVPNTPLHSFGLCVPTDQLTGQSLLDTISIGRCILDVFGEWKEQSDYFPKKAAKDLITLYAIYEQSLESVPTQLYSKAPISNVEQLMRQYLDELNKNPKLIRKFKQNRISVLKIMIDFANTIACGHTLQHVFSSSEPQT